MDTVWKAMHTVMKGGTIVYVIYKSKAMYTAMKSQCDKIPS